MKQALKRGSVLLLVAMLTAVCLMATVFAVEPTAAVENVTMVSATADNDGITVKWNAVSGADLYQVYRCAASEGTWKWLRNTGITTFRDTTAQANETYYYKVIARKSMTWSSLNIPAVSAKITPLPNVTMVSATASNDGITVNWNAVDGADLYQIYRCAASEGTWKWLRNTGITTFRDTTAQANETYYYKVIARKSMTWSSLNIPAVSAKITPLPNVTMVSATASNDGITVNWNAVDGADLYQIYRCAASEGTWKWIRNTGITTYVDAATQENETYSYKVIARRSMTWSSLDISPVSAVRVNPMQRKADEYTSPTDYLVLVDKTIHKVGVYTGGYGNWKNVLYVDCGDGKASTPTIEGVFYAGVKLYYFDSGSVRCFYATQIQGNYLFHSVLYAKTPTPQVVVDPTVGAGVSHGCVRLQLENAKWIYDNVPSGTKIVIYRS